MNELHDLSGQLGLEYKTISAMVNLYCKAHHHSKTVPCSECKSFLQYANEKLDRCPYGQTKPTCNKCPIHCYKSSRRQQAKEIMLYSGPRMLLWHPVLAIKHLIGEQRPIPDNIPNKASNRHIRRENKKQE